jgi:hypothetical protein
MDKIKTTNPNKHPIAYRRRQATFKRIVDKITLDISTGRRKQDTLIDLIKRYGNKNPANRGNGYGIKEFRLIYRITKRSLSRVEVSDDN